MAERGVSGVPIVVLASGSPRRESILRGLGLDPMIRPTRVDETAAPGETATDLVLRLAKAKLDACLPQLAAAPRPTLAIAADTVVEVDGSIMGKPEGKVDAERMLTMLSGRTHEVLTGLAVGLTEPSGESVHTVTSLERTEVSFRSLTDDQVDWYLDTGEAFDKAGSYGIQGRGALLVDRISGSYLNVVGLPVVALDRLCERLGWPLHRLVGTSIGPSVDNRAVIGT